MAFVHVESTGFKVDRRFLPQGRSLSRAPLPPCFQGGIPPRADCFRGMAGQRRRVRGSTACVPHRDDGECGEGQKGRNERLPCDVEFHVGGFFSGQN